MENSLRKSIFAALEQKETVELVAIWQANDRAAWTDEAFSVMEEILIARLGQLPNREQSGERSEPEEGGKQDAGSGPVLYSGTEVLQLCRWMNWMAVASVVVTLLYTLYNFVVQWGAWRGYFEQIDGNALQFLFSVLVTFLLSGLSALSSFLLLKGAAIVLKILMEMENHSRRAR